MYKWLAELGKGTIATLKAMGVIGAGTEVIGKDGANILPGAEQANPLRRIITKIAEGDYKGAAATAGGLVASAAVGVATWAAASTIAQATLMAGAVALAGAAALPTGVVIGIGVAAGLAGLCVSGAVDAALGKALDGGSTKEMLKAAGEGFVDPYGLPGLAMDVADIVKEGSGLVKDIVVDWATGASPVNPQPPASPAAAPSQPAPQQPATPAADVPISQRNDAGPAQQAAPGTPPQPNAYAALNKTQEGAKSTPRSEGADHVAPAARQPTPAAKPAATAGTMPAAPAARKPEAAPPQKGNQAAAKPASQRKPSANTL